MNNRKAILYAVLLALTLILPFAMPDFRTQLATLWLMIIVALTWDMTGGQMGYNSLGNIFFYGTGMYVAGVVAIAMVYDVGAYTDASGGGIFKFTDQQYFTGMFLGILAAGLFCSVTAVIIGYL
ncbi:MAG: branched-chain amino acid ABC transporter permease, partial [Gammaproteobacteria bacterium]